MNQVNPLGWKHRCLPGRIERTAFGDPCGICGATKPAPHPYSDTDVAKRDYPRLREVLDRAFDQAALGKGAARHGQDLPFEKQPMQGISLVLGTNAGLLYQAMKKAQESQRLPTDRAVAELLGAINYLAGAIIFLEGKDNGSQ